MNRYFLLFLVATTLLSACIPSVDDTASGLSDQATEVTAVITSSNLPPANTRTPTITIMPTSTVKVDVDIITSTTETPTKSVINETTNQRICTIPPQRFDLHKELGINRIADLRFVDEMLLTFEGWADRPDPSLMPLTPEPTPSMMPEPYPSARMLLVAGQLSINESRIEPRIVDFVPLLNNPCGETCPLEIISQSPDEQWQLVQVSDWLREKMGIWIVGKENMSQLTHYVPADMNWEWSIDSAMLWFVYSDPDRGGYSLIVQPGNPIKVDEGEYGSPLDPTFYFPTFSPIEKMVLSTANPFEQGDDTDELFILNVTESLTQTISTKVIPGIISVDWNEATQSNLIQIVNRNDEEIESVEIQNQDGKVLLTIPKSMLYSIIPDLTKELVPFYRFSLPGGYALSSSGRFLAVVRNSGEILLFECGVQK